MIVRGLRNEREGPANWWVLRAFATCTTEGKGSCNANILIVIKLTVEMGLPARSTLHNV